MNKLIKAAIVALALTFAAPAVASAKCPKAAKLMKVKKRFRNKLGKKVKVRVRYLNTQGYTIVDPTGIYYYVKNRGVKKGSHQYPAKYWYDAYPLYLVGKAMTYKIVIRNKAKRPLKNLVVVAQQEYLETNGRDGEDLPGCSRASWKVKKIKRCGKWVGQNTWITRAARSGLDQTHVQIQRRKGWCKRKLLWDKPQAGVFCPPEG